MIPVSQLSFDKPITVQVFDNEILATCNHAGASEGSVSFNDGLDGEYQLQALVCDKCPAYKVMTDDDREEFND